MFNKTSVWAVWDQLL